MGEARRPEPDLGDAQSVADLHQHVLVGHFEPFEGEFAVAAMLLRPHDRDAAQDAPAGLVAVEEERGEPAARIVRGAREQNEMVGDARAGDEPLVAVDHPGVALLLRAGADHAGIGAAAGRGLGHGEGGAHLAVDDGSQPFVLLRTVSHQREQIHIAVVGRGAVERERPEDRTIRFLVHRGPADDRQRHPAIGLRRLRRPQPLRPGLGLHATQHVEADVLVLVVIARSVSSGSTCCSTNRRVRRRMSSISGDSVKSMLVSLSHHGGRRTRGHRQPRNRTIWPPSTTMVVPAMKRPASETSSSSAPSRSRFLAEATDGDLALDRRALLARRDIRG